MILTKPVILRHLRDKTLRIEPFDPSSVGPASVDLTLDRTIRVFKESDAVVTLSSSSDYKRLTRRVDISKGFILGPGELVMGITVEKITLPGNICGWLQSRSRYARLGLMSHITAPFISPGVSNRQVLEIYNSSPRPILLKPGIKICHIIFETCEGSAAYRGVFKSQVL